MRRIFVYCLYMRLHFPAQCNMLYMEVQFKPEGNIKIGSIKIAHH